MMALSLVSFSASPVASLSLVTGRRSFLSASTRASAPSLSSSCLLRSSFLSSGSASFPSSFSGLSLGIDFGFGTLVPEKRRSLQVRAAKKYQLCQTKRNRSRKSLARTHGFRRRMRTTSGRAVIKRRRAKGRKVLCTKSSPSSGKGA